MSHAALAFVALFAPAAAALLLAVLPPLRNRGAPAAWLCIGASLGSLVAAILLLVQQAHGTWATSWLPGANDMGAGIGAVGAHVDGIAALMLVVVTVVATAVQVFSIGYMHEETAPSYGRYFTYHALFLFSMNLLVLAPDLLQLFAGWELVGVTSYLLIGFFYRKPSAARAAQKAFWITKLADMGFVLALAVLFSTTGAFGWDTALPLPVATAVTLLLFLAVAGKSAQFPLHVWLPDAMEGPTPVSALLHAATMVAAGVYLIVRAQPLFAQAPLTGDVMMVAGAVTALFAACLALVQADLKKVLAYSTVSQLGTMIAGLGAGAVFGGFFHLVTHAFFKALLFLAAGSVIHAVHSNQLADMGGLRRRMPFTTIAFAAGALSLAGIPGLAGFFSKDLVLAGLEGRLGGLPWAALLATAFLTAFYMGRVLVTAFLGAPRGRSADAREPGLSMLAPLALLTVPAVAAGWLAGPIAHVAGAQAHLHFGLTPVLASALGIGGLAAAWLVYGRPGHAGFLAPLERLAGSAAVNRLYELLYRRGLLAGAAVLGWIDRYVVDGLMNVIGWGFVAGGRALRRVQTGLAQDYLVAVVLGAVALAAWGLWP